MQRLNTAFWKNAWRLIRDYWYSEEKWYARGLLAVIVVLNLANVYILVLLNAWHNTFYNALQNYDKNGFFNALGDFCWIAAFYIIVAVYQLYLRQMLEIRWRRWMTRRYVKDWLQDRTYYKMHLVGNNTDNPDQRISEDLRLFASSTLSLSLGLLQSVVTLVSFVAILWTLSGSMSVPFGSRQITVPGYMVWVAIAYAAIGTWLTAKIGRPLVNLNFHQQRYEADFRFSLVRLRENSESIAFYGGEAREQSNFMGRFGHVFANFRQLMKKQKQLTWFTSGYGQIAIIFPLVVAAPRYFSNQIQLGGLIQVSSAFGRVQDALSFIVDSYTSLAEWQAVVNRLIGFTTHMRTVQSGQQMGITVECGDKAVLQVQNLHIHLPDGTSLLEPVNLELLPGETLLVAGPSGCGKSTLMRSLAGIWPFGSGCVQLPAEQSVLFLPQKSYLPLGTLRDVLLYPGMPDTVADEALREALVLCKLEALKDQLDRVADWSYILSLGEQQRIAFVRALIQQPRWLFLDEATSALDEGTERLMYQLLREKLKETTIISVGHRSTLTSFHKKKLTMDGNGRWTLLNL